ncbi:MAG: tryptophan synthase subunit alpha [Dehalococcoidia bacterium]
MSRRLKDTFARGKAEGRALFIAYVTAGYKERADTVPVLLALEEGGADVIELGIPFSDPLADGATIQAANEVALAQGVSLADCFAFIREARTAGLRAPVVFMGYYNPILSYGEARAAREAAAAGVDAFIVVDLPPEEAGALIAACRANDVGFVPLVAPTTREARIDLLAAAADDFLYCVSVTGTTGKGNVAVEMLPAFLARVRRHTDLPLAVGFGITRPEHVAAVGKLAEAAVVGSSFITTIERAPAGGRAEAVRAFVREMTGHPEG